MNRIGPYDIVGKLGVGGMGEVYRARDSRRSIVLRYGGAVTTIPSSEQ